MLGSADEVVGLKQVVDGDTLRLSDGRRVRLIGVNTPELAHRKRPAQPLAKEAKDFTERFLAGGDLELVYDRDRRDKHGRVLAHVYNHRGDSLESALLSAGLAFHIAVAPNLSLSECLASREQVARQKHRGVWSPDLWPVLQAAQVSPGDGGFVLLRGTVKKVHRNRFIWLDLDGPVALRVDPRSAPTLRQKKHWRGDQILVRGWLVDRGAKYARKNPKHKRWFIAVDAAETIDFIQ
ncbi:thermonuclease family protein [Microbulbifer agarilyticus]|uniref:thermonuclease family protein n=1 Tax=Microbulbifer agarilyticus TaxID=260552 RepID=UPI0018DBDC74|nr:thermonuclease family protein [Microbulbifer agarilyticus]